MYNNNYVTYNDWYSSNIEAIACYGSANSIISHLILHVIVWRNCNIYTKKIFLTKVIIN